jgi:tetratricopeptide (TPR) repeat protein
MHNNPRNYLLVRVVAGLLLVSCADAQEKLGSPAASVSALSSNAVLLPRTPARADAEALCQIGVALLDSGQDFRKAQQQLMQAAQADPTYAEPLVYLGVLAQSEDLHQKAAEWFEKYLKLDPSSQRSVEVRLRLKQSGEIIQLTSTPQGKAEYALVKGLARAKRLRDQGKLDDSLNGVDKLASEFPQRFEPRVLAATIQLRQQRYDDASASLKSALAVCPAERQPELERIAKIIQEEKLRAAGMAEGRKKLDQEDNAGAAAAFREVLNARPEDPEAGFALAGILSQSGDYVGALAVLQELSRSSERTVADQAAMRMIQIRPLAQAPSIGGKRLTQLPGGAAYLKVREALKAGDTNAALAASDQAVRALDPDPACAAYFVLQGDLLAAGGDVARAQAAFDRAAEIDPASASAQSRVASMALRQGDLPKAAGCFGLASQNAATPCEAALFRLKEAMTAARNGNTSDALGLLDDKVLDALKSQPALRGVALSCRARWREQSGQPEAQADLAHSQAESHSPWTAWRLAQTQAPPDHSKPAAKGRPKVDMSIFDK